MFRIADLTLKPHAGSARLQAAVEAACELSRQGVAPEEIAAVEVGIPAVIEGRLTNNDPFELQQAQMSVPFAVAMALTRAPGREWPPVFTLDDFERSLNEVRVRARSGSRASNDDRICAGTGLDTACGRRTA